MQPALCPGGTTAKGTYSSGTPELGVAGDKGEGAALPADAHKACRDGQDFADSSPGVELQKEYGASVKARRAHEGLPAEAAQQAGSPEESLRSEHLLGRELQCPLAGQSCNFTHCGVEKLLVSSPNWRSNPNRNLAEVLLVRVKILF